jgi:mono/diheme cytochrome c family protein
MHSLLFVIGVVALALPLAAAGAQEPSLPAGSDAAEGAARAPATTQDDIDGETMFATSCGFCHPQGGRAQGKGPKLAGIERSNEFIADRVRKGKPGAMPAFGRALSESQIMAIVAYIRTLDP